MVCVCIAHHGKNNIFVIVVVYLNFSWGYLCSNKTETMEYKHNFTSPFFPRYCD